MLDESHISLHTYADEGKMAVDVFTCGDTDARAIAEQLKADLKLEKFEQQALDRF
jgi:S-adenosylmethionine decarboxylase